MNIKGSKKKNQVLSVNIFEQQDIIAKADAIKAGLKASTWHELETRGKFDKNDKLSFVSDDMLILGCDIGSETHYVRAIDTRGRELSKSAFCFSNTAEGFESMLDWSTKLAVANDKKQPSLECFNLKFNPDNSSNTFKSIINGMAIGTNLYYDTVELLSSGSIKRL